MKSVKLIGSLITTFMFVALLLAGCGSETTDETTESTICGTGTKGPLGNATVVVYQLNSDGSRGEVLATASTASDGSFTASGNISGPVAVVVTGGSYIDEATGQTVQNDEAEELVTLLAEGADEENIGVTALTTIAAARASENAAIGLAQAIAAANQEVADLFGLSGIDIARTRVDDLTDPNEDVDADSAETQYGLIIAAISQVAKDNGLTPDQVMDLIANMADDFSDGELDGLSAGEALELAISITPEDAINGLEVAMDNFLTGDQNSSDLGPDDFSIEIPEIPVQ